MNQWHRCQICEHPHISAHLITVTKPNKREFDIVVCAMCALMFAGLAETGCQKEVNRGH